MASHLARNWRLGTLWTLSLVVVAVGSAWAQAPRPPDAGGRFSPLQLPTIVSGNDVGFRVERLQNGIPIGKLVVRLDGRWVDTDAPRIVPAR